MTDIQPDYTPFLNLVRPDTHDDVDATIDKIRAAFDAIDAWAQASGGGLLPDSWFFSYMVGFNDGVGAPASGEPFDWSGYSSFGPTIVGSDLRLNPADHHEIEVLTEGDYVIFVDVTIRSDVDPTEGVVTLFLDGSFVNHGWGLVASDVHAFRVAPYGKQVNSPWTTPPVRLLVGDTIKVLYVPNVQDGAVTALYGQITVKKVGP